MICNVHQFDISNPPQCLWKLSKQYGLLLFLRLGFLPVLVVSSANMAKEVFKTHHLTFSSRPALLGQRTLSYNFLHFAFSPYCAYWKEIRKICVIHLFNIPRVQLFRTVREDEVYRMIKKIAKSADACQPFNVSEATISLTSTIICRLAFGKRYEDEGEEKSRFNALQRETQAMLGSFFFADHFPLLSWVDKLTGIRHRLEKNFKECDEFY